MGWTDDLAAWFDSAFGDPMSKAVPGTVLIVAVSEPTGRSPYAKCLLDVVVEAPGVPITNVHLEAIVNRSHWPSPGTTLPARVSPARPEAPEIDWEALAR